MLDINLKQLQMLKKAKLFLRVRLLVKWEEPSTTSGTNSDGARKFSKESCISDGEELGRKTPFWRPKIIKIDDFG